MRIVAPGPSRQSPRRRCRIIHPSWLRAHSGALAPGPGRWRTARVESMQRRATLSPGCRSRKRLSPGKEKIRGASAAGRGTQRVGVRAHPKIPPGIGRAANHSERETEVPYGNEEDCYGDRKSVPQGRSECPTRTADRTLKKGEQSLNEESITPEIPEPSRKDKNVEPQGQNARPSGTQKAPPNDPNRQGQVQRKEKKDVFLIVA